MDITIKDSQNVTVVELVGEIDASTAPDVQKEVLPLAQSGNKILLDMSKVPYTSSAGLRFLLSLSRQVTAQNGQLVLVGVSEEIQDTMSVTGFLDFFTLSDDQEEGLQTLSDKQTPDTSRQDKAKGSKAERS
ncbi:anti-sigma factor antagonist [Floridanema evergladense]|uniref:Anti-sigma factor antagonist n=1 Tax=Floridaenema evergladense BLCC-F167 TaxID=3153639 RepID=A0ABV4WQ28_9CYAN